jgi:hypothetical protein
VIVNKSFLAGIFKSEIHGRSVVHTCNPTYKRGRDHEDSGLRPYQEKTRDPTKNKKLKQKGLG